MNGSAVCDKNNETVIQQFAGSTLEKITSFDNVSEIYNDQVYNQLKEAFTSFMLGQVTDLYSAKFHESLNDFEKLGFISATKRIIYERKTEVLRGGTVFAIELASDFLSTLQSKLENYSSKKNFEEFFLGWMGYINHSEECTPLLLENAHKLLRRVRFSRSDEEIKKKLMQYSNVSISSLPHISKNNRTYFDQYEKEQLKAIVKMVISVVDLDDYNVKERALEFIEEAFKISYLDSEKYLTDVLASQAYLSDLLVFSSINYVTAFQSLTASASEALKFAQYDISMDTHAQKRQNHRQKIIDIGKKVAVIGPAAVITKNPGLLLNVPRMDLLKLNNKLMANTLNPQMDQQTGFNILEAGFNAAQQWGITN